MNTTPIDDETLRRYLLGQAPADEQERIESLLVSDADGLAERLSELERDLIDRRLHGELEPREAADLREHFEWTTRRRRRLGTAVRLSGMGRDETRASWRAETEDGPAPRRVRWFGIPLPAPGRAVPVALAVLVIAAAAFQTGSLTGRSRAVSESWLTAAPPSRGGNVQEVRLTGAPLVRLRLDIGADDFESYGAEVYAGNDAVPVLRQGGLAAMAIDGRVALTLDLPASLLAPGTYSVQVSGTDAGASAPRGRYVFTVVDR